MPLRIILVWLAALSLITFILYGADKHRAKRGKWRISEKTLLVFGVLGGAAGGLLGMKVFRHKTKHRYFWVINFLALFAHIAAAAYILLRTISII